MAAFMIAVPINTAAAPVGPGWGIQPPICGILFPKPGCKNPPNPVGFSIFKPLTDFGTEDGDDGAHPKLVGIHCSFSNDVLMLAKSVADCESAGGEVQADLKAALAAEKSQ